MQMLFGILKTNKMRTILTFIMGFLFSFSPLQSIEKDNQKYFSFSNSIFAYHEIKSHSVNSEFKSEFVGNFNENYGFLYCQFQNIDNSTMTLGLININSFDEILNDVTRSSDNEILWENKVWK